MRGHIGLGLGGLSIALVLATSACTGAAEPKTSPTGGGCVGKIGFFGALGGPNSSLVLPSRDGAKLALKQFLAKNASCQVSMVEFDTEGEPAKATPVADKIATDKSFTGVIGGAFSGETRATKATYAKAGVPMISPSATATELTYTDQVPVFHRVVGYDDLQGAAIARYVKDVLRATTVLVVDDSTTYGAALGDKVRSELDDLDTANDKTQQGQRDFRASVSKVRQVAPDAVVYAGYAAEGGPYLQQLRAGGYTGAFIGGDGLYGSSFPKTAGDQSEGAIVTCACVPAERTKGSFADDFRTEYGTAPGAYAAEAFDAMNVFLAGIKAGDTSRADMEKFVTDYDRPGITKDITFNGRGDVEADKVVVWAYKVQDGTLVPDEEIPTE